MDWASQCAVVIPCLNEAATIKPLVEEIRRVLPAVWVVDDGSADATARLAQEAGAAAGGGTGCERLGGGGGEGGGWERGGEGGGGGGGCWGGGGGGGGAAGAEGYPALPGGGGL